MKSTISIARAGVLCLLLAVPALSAIEGVPRWQRTFHPDLPAAGNQSTATARELADGSTLTVLGDNAGLTTLQYDHDGNLLSSSTFYPIYSIAKAAIDPFGAVYIASDATEGNGYPTDVWLMKFDGLTGQALWPAGVTYGVDDHVNDVTVALFVDSAGDLFLETTDEYANGTTFTKYSGASGALLWGPLTIASGHVPSAAALDASGNLCVAFRSEDAAFHLTKYAGPTGAIVWQTVEAGHDLAPVTLGVDGAGNLVVTGGAAIAAGSIEADKYAGQSGQRIWGPAVWTPPAGYYSTAPLVAAVGADSAVVIFGKAFYDSVAHEVLLKFRGADGGLLWGPVFNTDPMESSYGPTLSLTGNGDAVLSAQIQNGESGSDAKMWRYDGATGDSVWGPEILVSTSIGETFVGSNGRVFVGATFFTGTGFEAQILERDGVTGVPAWGPKSFDGVAAGYGYLWDLTASPDGNVVVTGAASLANSSGAFATFKYDRTTGTALWGPVYFPTSLSPFIYSPWQTLTDASGDVFVGGETSTGMTVVKYAGSTGAQLWSTAGAPGTISAFALDPSGNPIVAGYLSDDSGNYDAVTVKFSGATGATLWGPIVYDSGSGDFPDHVASDPSGNVILIGHSTTEPPGLLLKYAAADGSILWGPVTFEDYATWLAVDAAGDIFEVGYGAGMTTRKYSGATGAILWGPMSVGDMGGGYGSALALDGAGDVFVTGSVSSPTTIDYAVIKYHGSDGAVLWGPVTYDGGGADYPYDVVVDGSGNAVVTGTSAAGSNEWRTATLSYDGGTGALRWGPVGQNIARDSVNGLAVSGSTVFVGATRGDVGYLVTAIDEMLGIETAAPGLPAASCGHAVDIDLGALNGTPPYSWSVTSGALPPGVSLGSDGHLTGPPSQEGAYGFRARVQDSAAASASRDFTLVVGPGSDLAPVAVAEDDVSCLLTLSVSGGYAGYTWQPGGQTTPTIQVNPTEPTTYGVVLDDGSTCRVRGAVTIAPADPDCVVPRVDAISPAFGPTGRSFLGSGNRFVEGATLSIGGVPVTDVVFEDVQGLEGHVPVLTPGSVDDVLVINPDGRYGIALRSFAADFLDVTSDNPFYTFIMRVDRAGITAGCGGGNYCPNAPVSRAQMAVFLLKAEHGFFQVPPPCTGVFNDVACPGGFAVDWIEQLAAEGITGGCGGGNYCPDAVVTRAQMSAFLLKAEHGSSYVPPPCIGVFGDVPCGSPFADWIEQLFHESITSGCGENDYCPDSPNTRAQMAVLVGKTFGLH